MLPSSLEWENQSWSGRELIKFSPAFVPVVVSRRPDRSRAFWQPAEGNDPIPIRKRSMGVTFIRGGVGSHRLPSSNVLRAAVISEGEILVKMIGFRPSSSVVELCSAGSGSGSSWNACDKI